MFNYIWNYCLKNKLEPYTVLYTPIRVIEDIYVLQSGKFCRIRSQYFSFKGQCLYFKAWGTYYRKEYICQAFLEIILIKSACLQKGRI